MSLFDSFGSLPEIPQGVKDFGTNISNGATDLVNSAVSKFETNLNLAEIRKGVSGLLSGGMPAATKGAPARFSGTSIDWRVKVALAPGATYFYKNSNPGILAPLAKTQGVIFPYTPQVSVTHTARYGSQQLTHSNYTNYSYEGSEVAAISITGDFTAQNAKEAAYVLACIHFFRSATKMWFGQGSNVGSPPPMLFLSGYGANYFPNVPCVLTSFQHSMPQDVDYVQAAKFVNGTKTEVKEVPMGAGTQFASANYTEKQSTEVATTNEQSTMVPTLSQIQITLQPIYSRSNVYKRFDLTKFANGSLLSDDTSGGFI